VQERLLLQNCAQDSFCMRVAQESFFLFEESFA